MNRFLTQSISVFLGFTFWGAGMAKLYLGHAFIGWIGPAWLIERLEEYGLGFYGEFVAVSQVIVGYLLLTTRFKLLGSIMLIPLLVNILMVTISLEWRGTPYVLAVLLGMNLYLLWQFREFFQPLVNESLTGVKPQKKLTKTWIGHGVWMAGLSLNLLSIVISHHQLVLAYLTVGIGLLLSLLAFAVDRYYLTNTSQIPE